MGRGIRTRRAGGRSGNLRLAGFVAAAALAGAPAFAGGPLAMDRPEAATQGRLTVSSAAFAANSTLPARFSAQGGDRSPPLHWTMTEGAQSYAIILEDPDAPGAAPFVHWVAWNIPASAEGLPEGAPSGSRITSPVPMSQGRNGAGTTGYFGPRPPAGIGPDVRRATPLAQAKTSSSKSAISRQERRSARAS